MSAASCITAAPVPQFHAVPIADNKMAPVIEKGGIAYFDGTVPRDGDHCLVRHLGASAFVLYRLDRLHADRYEVRQWNPDRRFSVPKAQVAEIYKAVYFQYP